MASFMNLLKLFKEVFILKKYQIIYADPPWQYKVYSEKGKGRSAENHYSTMNIDDICKLPIKKLADNNCTLIIWIP